MKVTHLFLFILSISFTLDFAFAQPSIDDYAQLESASMLRISPSGKRIAFLKRINDKTAIVVLSLKTKKMLSAINIGKRVKVTALNFVDDERLILKQYKYDKIRLSSGYFDFGSAFVLHVVSGKLRQLLTPGHVIYRWQSHLGRIVGISKDGNYAFMPAYVAKRDADDNPNYSLLKVPLNNNRPPKIVRHGKPYSEYYFIDDKDQLLAEVRYKNSNNKYQILVREGDEWREHYAKTIDIFPRTVGITPNRQSIILAVYSKDSNSTYYSEHAIYKKIPNKAIFRRKDSYAGRPLIDLNSIVYGAEYGGFYPDYEFFDESTTERFKKIQQNFPEHSVTISSWTPNWEKIIVRVEGNSSSGSYYLIDENDDRKFLTYANKNIRAKDINPVGEFSYTAKDGLKIPALMTIPKKHHNNIKKLPAIMLPLRSLRDNDRKGYDWLAQALASQGYLVIQPQFRGSTGFGRAHEAAGLGEWGKKMQTDLSDGLKTLIANDMVDPKRICIVGLSYGGYAALAGGAFDSALYQCHVSVNGVSDIPVMLNKIKNTRSRDNWLLDYWGRQVSGDKDKDNYKRHASVSPARFAERFNAPVLLIYSNQDTVVDNEQSRLMYRRLKRAGKDVESLELVGDNHYLSEQTTRRTALHTIINFVNKHIGEDAIAQAKP